MGWAWDIFQPLLFGLIGAEIRVSELEGPVVGKTSTAHTNILKQHRAVLVITVKYSNLTIDVNIFA